VLCRFVSWCLLGKRLLGFSAWPALCCWCCHAGRRAEGQAVSRHNTVLCFAVGVLLVFVVCRVNLAALCGPYVCFCTSLASLQHQLCWLSCLQCSPAGSAGWRRDEFLLERDYLCWCCFLVE
jgi:hypothetical protein